MNEFELKYGCNPNQKPAKIFTANCDLPIEVLNGKPGYINFMDAFNGWLLVKELKVNILLTTHSSNFVLALDAYMRKHEIQDKTNFYQTNSIDNGFVEYSCVNDDISSIYADFLQYLSDVKVLRDKFLMNGEDDELTEEDKDLILGLIKR